MPRGRHRQSQPLHRILPPATVAGSATVFAGVAWASADPVVIRIIAAAAAAVACAGAVLLRSWDQGAGREVAELRAARTRDEWRNDERIAELEGDLDESRGLRGSLEGKLRGKRAELARLRTEHAELLRRYATAESERARVLESRRQLATGGSVRALGPMTPQATIEAYRAADVALRNLSRNAARQDAQRTVAEARIRDAADTSSSSDEPEGRHAAQAGRSAPAGQAGQAARTALAAVEPHRRPGPSGRPSLPVREHRLIPAVAAAVLPYAQPQKVGPAIREKGGFDFFGLAKSAAEHDLADVVGDEAYAEHEAEQAAAVEDEAEAQAQAEADALAEADAEAARVVDLTAHDETEQLDMSMLRLRPAKSS